MIPFVCACGRKATALPGVEKMCQGCGARITVGSAPKTLTKTYLVHMARIFLGLGDEKVNPRQVADRTKEIRAALAKLKTKKISELSESNLQKFMDLMGWH